MPRYSDERIEQALTRARGMVYVAARILKCSPNTIKARLAKSEHLQRVQKEESEILLDVAELKLIEAVERGEWWAIKYTLSTLGKSRGYTTRTEVAGGNDQQPIKIVEVSARKALRKEDEWCNQ